LRTVARKLKLLRSFLMASIVTFLLQRTHWLFNRPRNWDCQ